MRKEIFTLFITIFSFSGKTYAVIQPECAQLSFQMDFWMKDKQMVSIAKNACKLKFVRFSGAGEKWLVDLCNPKINIETYAAVDSSEPYFHFAGSSECKNPLFGVDMNKSKKENKFPEIREKLFQFIVDANSDNPKDEDTKIIRENLLCIKELMKNYLNNCKSFEIK